MMPKDGSNTFKGSVFWSQTPGDWQNDNFTPELAAKGLRAPNRVSRIFDLNLGLGGPILKDRLWFYSSFRRWGVDQTITDSFYNLDPTHRTYQPDLSHQAIDDNVIKSGVVRLTLRISQKHDFAAYLDRIVKFRVHECPALSSEQACGIRSPMRYFTAHAKYTATLTNRLLLEAGWSDNDETYSTGEVQRSVGVTDVARYDRTTDTRWSSYSTGTTPRADYYFRIPDRHTFSGTMSYVTGSHALKTGFQLGKGGNTQQRQVHGGIDLVQEYRNGAPVSVVVSNTPVWTEERIKYDLGLFVQDSWTFRRVTINPGLRIERFNTPVNISGVSNKTPGPGIKRPYQWEYTLGIQREVMHSVSVSANWVRRDYRRLFWTDNVLTTQDDYTLLQIRNPLDASELIPIYNLNPAKRGLLKEVDKNSATNRRWYNGVDVGVTARAVGGNGFGGPRIGRQVFVNCEVDDPNSLRFCDQRDLDIPYLAQFKLAGSYPLPFQVQISGSWQGYPGVPSGTARQDVLYNSALNRVEDP